jgi:hypothetical protein
MSELHHISDCDLDRYHCEATTGPELAMLEEHLFWCVSCIGREEEIREKGRSHVTHTSTDDLEL